MGCNFLLMARIKPTDFRFQDPHREAAHTRTENVASPLFYSQYAAVFENCLPREQYAKPLGSLLVQDNTEEGIVYVDLAVVLDKTELSEFVHKHINSGPRCTNHFCQRLLRYFGEDLTSTRYIRFRGRFGAHTLLGVNNSRELAREIVKAYDCKLTHFQPASRQYPMTLVCEAEDNQKIAKVLRGLDVFGYVETETAKIA